MLTITSGLALHWKVDSTNWYGKLVYSGNAWVSIGRSSAGYMVGSDVIVGLPSAGTTLLYDLTAKSTSGVSKMSDQSALTSGSISQASSTTTMTFTSLLDQTAFDVSASGAQDFIWAYGSGNSLGFHAGMGAFSLDLTTCSTSTIKTEAISTSAVLAHGALMLLAWAYIFPGGILCAYLKFVLGDVWMNAHLGLQAIGAVVAIAAICTMSLTIDGTDGAEHLSGDHPPWGVAALALLALQLLGGFLRPHKVPGEMTDYKGIRDWVWKPQQPKRRAFQYLHKLGGYAAMLAAAGAILSGIYQAADYDYISSTQATVLYVFAVLPLVALLIAAATYNYVAIKNGGTVENDDGAAHRKMDDL